MIEGRQVFEDCAPNLLFRDIIVIVAQDVSDTMIARHGSSGWRSRTEGESRRAASDMISRARVAA